jgi:hypothetical protein
MYASDSNGLIKQLYLPYDETVTGDYIGDKYNFVKYTNNRSFQYMNNKSTLSSLYWLQKDFMLFYVPADKSELKGYRRLNKSFFVNEQTYSLSLYDLNASRRPKVAVYKAASSSDSLPGANYKLAEYGFLIKKISQVLNDEAEPVMAFEGIVNGVDKVIYFNSSAVTSERLNKVFPDSSTGEFKDTTKINGLKIGDLIQVELNQYNEITWYRIILRSDNADNNSRWIYGSTSGLSSYTSSLACIYGLVIDKASDVLTIDAKQRSGAGELSQKSYALCPANTRIYRFNKSTKTVQTSSYREISIGDRILIHNSGLDIKQIVIYD